jgi:hypothetical protein
MSSIGGGYAWPRIAFFGEGERVGCVAKSDPSGAQNAISYETNALAYFSADAFEDQLDQYLSKVVNTSSGFGSDQEALHDLLVSLNAERCDPDLAQWRRLEAISGFDPDEAPEQLMEGLTTLLEAYSADDVEELAVASAQSGALGDIGSSQQAVDATGSAQFEADFRDVLKIIKREQQSLPEEPWQRAEIFADALRYQLGLNYKPLRNAKLSELCGVPAEAFKSVRSNHSVRNFFGLRMRASEDGRQHLYFHSKKGAARRFEAACMLGDVIWTLNSAIGPIAGSQTARQKFQRAFAASLLCPHRALVDFLNTDSPSDENIDVAAKHFHVSWGVVRTILVNKKIIERNRLNLPFSDLGMESSMEHLVEAA